MTLLIIKNEVHSFFAVPHDLAVVFEVPHAMEGNGFDLIRVVPEIFERNFD